MVTGRMGERGVSLLAALLVALLIGAVVVLVGEQHQLRFRAFQAMEREAMMTALVDAATAEALAAVAADPDTSGVATHDFGDGEIGSRARRLDATTVSISAIGAWGGWESVQLLTVRVGSGRPVVTEWQRRFVRPVDD